MIGIIGDTNNVMRGGVPVPNIEAHLAYAECVARRGGIAMVIPNLDVESVLEGMRRCDGLLLAGGFDHLEGMGDSCYGDLEITAAIAETLDQGDKRRQVSAGKIIRTAITERKPILGICHGMQAINVALGGTLYPDIKQCVSSIFNHADYVRRFEEVHDVTTRHSGEELFRAHRFGVNSRHHQAVHKLGNNLEIIAVAADDGITEAIRYTGECFVVGVQWHPEDLYNDEAAALFAALIRATAHTSR